MPFDLVARLVLQDRLSGPMAKAEQSLKAMERTTRMTERATSGYGAQNERLAKSFTSVRAAAASGGSGISAFVRHATAAAAAIGGIYAAKETVSKALELSSNAEQAQIGFTTMLGSAEKAKSFMQELTDFANKTPFTMPQLRDASKKLLAFGFDAQRIIPMMTAIGDASAGLGAGSEGIERITRALGQIKSNERLNSEDMNQLTDVGIPAWTIMAEKMKTTTAHIRKMTESGIIPANVAINALIDGMEKRFPHMMDEQSNSLSGLWSTIKDTFDNGILKRFGDGISKGVKPSLEKLRNWIDDNGDKIEEWAKKIETKTEHAVEWMAVNFRKGFDYVKTNFLDNPEFQNLSTSGKFEFVVKSLRQTYDDWYANGGETEIKDIAKSVTDFLGTQISVLSGPLTDAGLSLGKALGQGIYDGVRAFMKDNPLTAGIIAGMATPGPIQAKAAVAAGVAGQGATDKATEWFKNSKTAQVSSNALQKVLSVMPSYDSIEKILTGGMSGGGEPKTDSSNATGLNYVPRDGWTARLHRGEMVLPAGQADAYRNGTGGGITVNIPKLADHLVVREDADLDRIVDHIVRGLDGLQGAMAQ